MHFINLNLPALEWIRRSDLITAAEMSQSNQPTLSQESSSRYRLPSWFVERNIKDPSRLEGCVPICQCEYCETCKKLYENEEKEWQNPGSESTADFSRLQEKLKPKSPAHEDCDYEDAITYRRFSELRNLVTTSMVWRHMRPEESSVLFRRCSTSDCKNCLMEAVRMDDIVTQVAKSLGMGLVSLSYEDLEELGSEFHFQDKGYAVSSSDQKTAEGNKTEKPSTTETSAEGTTKPEARSDKGAENEAEGTINDVTKSRELIKDEWKPDWSDATTFANHFFAAKSKKWEDEANFSYSAWRDRTRQSYTAILDGASTKSCHESKPQEGHKADNDEVSKLGGLLVHFIDCEHSGADLEYRRKRRILVRLGELVQERRRNGQAVVLVISSKTLKEVDKLCRKAGVSTLSGLPLLNFNYSKKNWETRDLQRKGTVNTRRLRWILEIGMSQLVCSRPELKWFPGDEGDDLALYGRHRWSLRDIHLAAGQILARVSIKPQPVVTSKHVDSVLRRLHMLKSPEPAEKTDAEEKSAEPETKVDEVVEEAPQDPLEGITLDDHEERFRECVIKTKDLNLTWDDIILDEDTKDIIKNLVPSSKLEVEASSDFLLSQLRIRGCLLYGPPGTGKTHLCRAIASSSGSRMLAIDYATAQSSLVGEAEKNIHAAFSLATKMHPCVLFIDEADALFYRRASSDRSWERAALTQFLVEMEGLAQNPNAPLVVVATNRPWDLDEAFLRRLPQKFYIGLPDRDARAAILRLFLTEGDLDPAVDVGGIADATKGFSGSDLKSLCAEAALVWKIEQGRLDALCGGVSQAFATARGTGPKRLRLDVDHFAAAFEKMQPSRAAGDSADQLARFSRRYNPVQDELGRGNGGKRYIFNDARGKNETLSVRELISRIVPAEEESPANMQLVVWRSAEEVLFPWRASSQKTETPPLGPVTTGMQEKSSEEASAAISDEERSEDQENDSAEPKAHSAEVVSYSDSNVETGRSASDQQDLRTPDSSSTTDETVCGSEESEPEGPGLLTTVLSALEAQKMKPGADVDLIPILLTLAAVIWYNKDEKEAERAL